MSRFTMSTTYGAVAFIGVEAFQKGFLGFFPWFLKFPQVFRGFPMVSKVFLG